ncbi:MAG: hypothetical protein WC248_03355 [Candidatus Methanomethylophilaceae archaeon]|jgi:hypothetical protein
MRPATREKIERETPFAIEIATENVMDETGANLSDVDREYFVETVDMWVRWQYANTPRFKYKMKKGDMQYIEDFITHWLNAFSKNPEQFKEQHPTNALV